MRRRTRGRKRRSSFRRRGSAGRRRRRIKNPFAKRVGRRL